MNAHRFDPVAAVFALVALAAGVTVAYDAIDPLADSDAGVWPAVIALAVGFVLIPWGRRNRAAVAGEDAAD